MKKWIYKIEIDIDENLRDEILEYSSDEEYEILSAIESLPYVVSIRLDYAITKETLVNLKSIPAYVYEKDI